MQWELEQVLRRVPLQKVAIAVPAWEGFDYEGLRARLDELTAYKLWRSVKYEEVYLRAYETVSQAREGNSCYFDFFNAARPHTAHGGKTSDSAYYTSLPAIPKAA
jgi:hypothetical protein